MSTIIISDATLLGPTLEDTKRNMDAVTNLKLRGEKIVILSNEPFECMKSIFATQRDGQIKRDYFPSIDIRTLGLEMTVRGEHEAYNDSIDYDFAIGGNGAFTVDNKNHLIDERFISEENRKQIIHLLFARKYEVGDQNANAYFEYIGGTKDDLEYFSTIFGIRAFSGNRDYDEETISIANATLNGIQSYMLNGNIYFYGASTNKLCAVQNLINNGNIAGDDIHLILGSKTDTLLAVSDTLLPAKRYIVETPIDGFLYERTDLPKVKALHNVLDKVA